MAITKIPTNKAKTKFSWKVVVHIPVNEFDSCGKQKSKHHYVGCYKTEKEAKHAEREFLNNLEQGAIELNKKATCKDVLNFYIEYAEKEAMYSKGTIANYKCIHREHLKMFDDMLISNIRPAHIRVWRRGAIEKGLSPYRINDCIKLLKSSCNYAIKEKEISCNPFIDMNNITLPKKIRHRFSTVELVNLLKSCKNKLPEYYCMFSLSCLTGMRVGEYVALTVKDINFDNKIICVEKQYTRGELKDRTKTIGSTRLVHPSTKTLEIIKWHLDTFNIQSGFLFPDTNGNKPVSAKWVSRKFRQLLKLNDYPENYCRVHDLRGQYVDIQHAVGTPTELIAKEVGHSRTSTTSDIYTQILAEVPKEMNNRMDARLFNK